MSGVRQPVLGGRWCIVERGFPLNKIEEGPLHFFIFAVTIVVVAIPEGLPLAVTISLAYRCSLACAPCFSSLLGHHYLVCLQLPADAVLDQDILARVDSLRKICRAPWRRDTHTLECSA